MLINLVYATMNVVQKTFSSFARCWQGQVQTSANDPYALVGELRIFEYQYILTSNNKLLLCPPSFRTLSTLGDRAFMAAAPKLQNVLPLNLRSFSDFNVFKQDLKTYLFKQAFINQFLINIVTLVLSTLIVLSIVVTRI